MRMHTLKNHVTFIMAVHVVWRAVAATLMATRFAVIQVIAFLLKLQIRNKRSTLQGFSLVFIEFIFILDS